MMEFSGDNPEKLHLPTAGLIFDSRQLVYLTEHFCDQENNLNEDIKSFKSINSIEVAVERLIQRLICGVGMLDHRFSSKFLVNLEPKRFFGKQTSLSFSYLVRLDCLSFPALYPDAETTGCTVFEGDGVPQGFARIRVHGENIERWAEFINNNGFLRRDKVQERFVELLAQATARSTIPGPPDQIDEANFCGSPGKIVDAGILHSLLQIPVERQMYYAPAKSNGCRFPDPRDFRIAIVEGSQCVRLRVGFLSPGLMASEDAEVTLVLGVGFSGWPASSDFTNRASVVHIDALLFHHAAATGFYLVPAGPHPTVRCEDKSSVWEFRFPAAETTLVSHYSGGSVVAKVLSVLFSVLVDIRNKQNGGNVMSKYILKTLFLFHLETNGAHYQTPERHAGRRHARHLDRNELLADLRHWTYDQISRRVLLILDEMVAALRTQRYRSYFFKYFNVMMNCPGGGTLHYTDEDYAHEADLLTSHLHQLHQMSSLNVTFPSLSLHLPSETWWKIELQLIAKWRNVLTDLLPSKKLVVCNKKRRFLSLGREYDYDENSYSNRQLEYIGQVLRGLLHVKSLIIHQSHHTSIWLQTSSGQAEPKSEANEVPDPAVDDVIYLISILMEQAWKMAEQRVSNETNSLWLKNKARHDHEKSKAGFQTAVEEFLKEIRRDLKVTNSQTDTDLVHFILQWLYRGAAGNERRLGAVLRPFLRRLFLASHENCWYLDEYVWRKNSDEVMALGQFCELISNDNGVPLDGLLDAVQKGWDWADGMLNSALEINGGTELVLTPSSRTTIRLPISINADDLPLKNRRLSKSNSLRSVGMSTLPPRPKATKDTLRGHLYRECLMEQLLITSPDHCRLRDSSPLTQALEKSRRYGSHRGLGSIVNALITLNKFTILQEVSLLLPEDQRHQILDDIHKISRERRRHKRTCNERIKKNSATLPRNLKPKGIDFENATYRSISELALLNETVRKSLKMSKPKDHEVKTLNENNALRASFLSLYEDLSKSGTLLGTCRLARSRNTENSFLYNPSAFYDAPPSFYENISNNLANYSSRSRLYCNPLSQPYLQLTPDKTLCLSSGFSSEAEMESLGASAQYMRGKDGVELKSPEKEMVTKL
ncbi:unnamed protein product [Bemisia tabaci]|uniref:Mab-21-like HhH/H2TH-like domain-containing protein n=1 Tax=Bemisia tabaci TaxID=7038 RepID=A0A9N9ZZX3_BEMTA|nr:unnamed protein product [Bemisia tabaci]